ncbi:MAG TPA: benzoyl-CoA reductase subunit D [Planctomycetes bacterium]|nr:benzoyl-CoA reductase subunit D [Planctomycetota bacterium]
MTKTVGIDVGSSTVKCVVMEGEGQEARILAKISERVRRRNPVSVIRECLQIVLDQAGLSRADVDYIATTGEGELVPDRTGHFYSMTAHSRGGLYLEPEARAVLDVGALHARAILMDDRAKVLSYRMTSQCASGSGQFVENISRYLGVALDEVGELSKSAEKPEKCSSICAVLAETDVINMVSRGIAIPDILKGIHLSMAGRLVKLLQSAKVDDTVLMTGGLSADAGLVAAVEEILKDEKRDYDVRTHPDSILAGAIGAALWGAFRHRVLKERGDALIGDRGGIEA